MNIYTNRIPFSHFIKRVAQVIPEQSLMETVNVYEDAIPYIRCMIQSTIQHEAGHRSDETGRNEEILTEKTRQTAASGYPCYDIAKFAQIMPFDQFTSDSRAEPIAEREEENCDPLMPQQMSDKVISVNLNQLFEEAKSASKIDPNYKSDVKAGHLPPEAQGMYLMQDRSNSSIEDLVSIKESRGNVHVDEQNNLWVDVRKIVEPFITDKQPDDQIQPPTYQGPSDGAVQADLPGVSQQAPQGIQAVPGTGAIQGTPGIPSRESR